MADPYQSRTDEYRSIARDCLRMGRYDLAWQFTALAAQEANTPRTVEEMVAKVFARAWAEGEGRG